MKPWYRAYVGTVADEKIAEAAMVGGVSRCVILAAWQAILESASYEERDGAFSTTPRRVAAILAEPLATIEAAFAAIAEVGMIADGIVVRWRERQFASDAAGSSTTRVQAYRERRRGPREGTDETPDPPGITSSADRPTAPAADIATCNAGSALQSGDVTTCNAGSALQGGDVTLSESETESESESSSVVVPFAPRAGAPPGTRDDDEFLIEKVSKALGGRAEAKVVRAGLGTVRGWLDAGCDLEGDVLPELAQIGRKLTRPLATFAAPWLTAQVMAVRSGRLAAQKARGSAGPPPERVFVAEGTPEWAKRVAAGHRPSLNYSHDEQRRSGWYFPVDPPRPDEAKAAR